MVDDGNFAVVVYREEGRWDAGLLPERLIGDLNYAVEGLVQFKNQENCSGHRERYYDHGDNHCPVRRREQAEAKKNDGEPNNHYYQEGLGDGTVCLREQKPAQIAEIGGDCQRLGFERALLRRGMRFPFGGSLIAVAARERMEGGGHA